MTPCLQIKDFRQMIDCPRSPDKNYYIVLLI